MDRKWRGTFLNWTKMRQFKQSLHEAEVIIERTLKRQEPYVAYSGGKDSTVLLHLVLQQNPDIMVLHWDYGQYFMPRVFFQEVLSNARKMGVKNLQVVSSPSYKKLGRKALNVWGKEFFKIVLPRLRKKGYTAVFTGLRGQESVARQRVLRKWRAIGGILEVWPLKNWSWLDVWGYITVNNLPYVSIYDKYAPILGWDKTRFVTFFDPQFENLGASNIDGVLSWRHRHG